MIVKVLDSFKDEKSGSTVIEAALCIPVLLSLIFFILEMIKITILQSTIDSMTLETTFDYCAFKDTEHFDSIIKKIFHHSLKMRRFVAISVFIRV